MSLSETVEPATLPRSDAALLGAVHPLVAVDPSERAIAPPQRHPIDAARECLVQWQPDAAGLAWTLTLTARPLDVSDTATPLSRLAIHMPTGGEAATLAWEGEDPAFRDWLAGHLPALASDLAQGQPAERQATIARAGLSSAGAQKLAELLPHVVLLAALAAFVYMFGVVHIK